MSPSPRIPEEHAALWRKLQAFPLDDAQSPLPFRARLARENGWPLAFAARVAEEYKRFLFLAMTAGHPVSPSPAVDQAWHLHLLYTRSYWNDLCRDVLGKPLHHEPTRGGAAEGAKFADWYARTRDSYRSCFGEPPADLWPAQPKHGREQWVDLDRHWLMPKPRLPRLRRRAAVVAATAAATVSAQAATPTLAAIPVLDWQGPEFLILYVVLFAAALILAVQRRRAGLAALENDAVSAELSDPRDIAVLAGGAPRHLQTTLAAMLMEGQLRLTRAWSGVRWLPGEAPPGVNDLPARLWEKANSRLPKGASTVEITAVAREEITAVETRLALAGLRPRAEEAARVQRRAAAPFIWLIAFGMVKLFIGIARDKPVIFLSVLITLSVIALVVTLNNPSKLTAKGLNLLNALRAEHTRDALRSRLAGGTTGAVPILALGVALFGPAFASGLPGQPALNDLEKAFANQAGAGGGSSSGCGTSSGCGGDGGGGGGGCGGCGGGGD